MSRLNPLLYISIPFTYLWEIINESGTTKNKSFFAILGFVLMTTGLFVLFKWHEIPTYTHDIYIKKVFVSDSLEDKFITVNYQLYLYNSGIITPNLDGNASILERLWFSDYVIGDTNRKGKGCMHNPYGTFVEVIGREIPNLDSQLKQKKYSFNYGFILIHSYLNDHPKLRNVCSVGIVDTLLLDNSFKYRIAWIERTTHKTEDSIFFKNFWRHSSAWNNNVTPQNFYARVHYEEKGIKEFQRVKQNSKIDTYLNKLRLFCSMHDISKAKYSIYFDSEDVDSTEFTIVFNENVTFSKTNAKTDKIENDRITFTCSEINYMNSFDISNGLRFSVSFDESSNLQSIRILLLTALLALPLGMFVKNIWALLTTPSAQNSTNKKEKRRKSLSSNIQKEKL